MPKRILAFFNKIKTAITEHPMLAALLRWTKTHSLPGFFGVPIYDVTVFLIRESQRVTLISRANAMAFSFFLSLFPAIIFLFTVATLLPIYDTFEHEINSYIEYIMPTNAGKELQSTIKELVKPNSSFLSIGFILALYFASNGMLTMMDGFEKTHLKVFRKRGEFRKRLIAIGLTMQLGLLLAASVVLIILGDFIIHWMADLLNLSGGGEQAVKFFRWIVILLLFYFGIAFIYRYGAALNQRFKWITPGATMATILSIISSVAFSFYVEAFGTYNKIYGSIGTIIVLMLWIQINCFILQTGFELNASIAVNRDLKEELMEENDGL
jgi:membrane protein